MLRPIVIATAICGSLDIAFAMILTLFFGRHIGDMLRSVASGPFPAAVGMGSGGAILGLVVHFTLMAIMVAVFVLAARQLPTLVERPLLWGVAYGLVTYVVMNLIVVPLRFPAAFPPKTMSIITQVFAHIVLVGLPTAYIAARYLRPFTK